jgi:ribosomal protein L31E
MAGRGFPSAGRRQRPDHQATLNASFTDLADDGEVRGFPLPDNALPGGEEWHPMTLQWWDTWRRSPQAQRMLDTDWQELLATAVLHHAIWSKGRWEHASEVRLRVAKFGATPEDRMRLKLNVTLPEPDEAPMTDASGAVTDISSRRSRLSG